MNNTFTLKPLAKSRSDAVAQQIRRLEELLPGVYMRTEIDKLGREIPIYQRPRTERNKYAPGGRR